MLTGLVRHRSPDVVSLPVWDLVVEGRPFWRFLLEPSASALGAAVAACLSRARSQHGIDCAWIGGGQTLRDDVRAEIASRAPLPVSFSTDGRFVGEAGGLALLPARGLARGVVVDVGQTGVKVSVAGRRFLHERDLSRLPLRLIGPDGTSGGAATEPAAAFIADAIARALATPGVDPALVLALPCPIDDDLGLGPCTYGWEGDRALVPSIVERTGARTVLLLNDAELAAESARVALGPDRPARVFVLTLGFGPGGALLDSKT